MKTANETVIATMRAARDAITRDEEQLLNEIAGMLTAMVWVAVEDKAGRVSSLAPDMPPDKAVAIAMLGIAQGAMSGAARCAHALGITAVEFQGLARDAFASSQLEARVVP